MCQAQRMRKAISGGKRTRKPQPATPNPIVETTPEPQFNGAEEYPNAEEILRFGRQLGQPGTSMAVMHARFQLILGFMQAGIPTGMIRAQCAREYGMSRNMVDNIMIDVRKAWRTEWEESLVYAKAEVINRLRRDLALMRQQSPRSWRDIRGHEQLLARIEGTEAPVRVAIIDADAEMRDAIVGVLGSMSAADMQAFVTEGHSVELKQLPPRQAQAAE